MSELGGLEIAVAENFLGTLFQQLFAPERLNTREYTEKYIYLSPEVTSDPGRVNLLKTPCLLAYLKYVDDPETKVIIAKKPAQFGWTQINNFFIERVIVQDPQNIMIAFPSDALIKRYTEEKLRVAIRNSPALLTRIGDPDKCRYDFFKYPGGWLSLVSAASDNALKSSSAPILFVEEPDGLKQDLKGQGNALNIFLQRSKTFPNSLLVYGGTPVEEGSSNVDDAYELSNKMVFMVVCHVCEKFHVLGFSQLKADTYPGGKIDKTFGRYNPETAYYECPHCLERWGDKELNNNLVSSTEFHDLGWVPTAESHFIGFAFNELMSTFLPGSSLYNLKKNWLEALVEKDKGKPGKLKSYTNNSMGLSYKENVSDITAEALKAQRIFYEEKTVPAGGLIITAGIDVQWNRLAVVLTAHGRSNNSWVIYWGELFGYVKDPEDPVWEHLTKLMLGKFRHELSPVGRDINLPISGISIDSGDGNTVRLVYRWVQQMCKINPHTYATKGDHSVGFTEKEIFTVPVNPEGAGDKDLRKRVMETMGVTVYHVGVQKGKSDILRRIALTGGRDRIFVYQSCREDFENQLLSNYKKGNPPRYELTPGERDEALDCIVLCEHSKHALGIQLYTEKHWQQLESSIVATVHKNTVGRESNVAPGLDIR
jgi:phage terminase large subunit GpA-like protein